MSKTHDPLKGLTWEWKNDTLVINPRSKEREIAWNEIDWKKIERIVFKLQKRIYQTASRGEVQKQRRLQKTLIHSRSAKLLAVRRVTQDNQGRHTAGVDGVKSLSPTERMNLAGQIQLGKKSKPTRRVWIPKPGRDEKRPLGIPTIDERAKQALVKLALEPEWETKFEPNSYGFRPGRCCQDAIEAIYTSIAQKPKYVLDADIAKCFDRIKQNQLMTQLNTFPTLARQIRAWLKSGVMERKNWFPTEEGTPQGGVISPLLANIALHGMEEAVKRFAETLPNKRELGLDRRQKRKQAISLIRYADDFVIMYPDLEGLLQVKELISTGLANIGLELKPSKTRITHTKDSFEGGKPGFDFLGFNIRQYPVGKTHTGKTSKGKLLGFKTLIKPSPEKVLEHYRKIAEIIDRHRAAPQAALIKQLNPLIVGWCNNYQYACSKEIFSTLNSLIWNKLRRWTRRRHPTKSKKWVTKKYWHTYGNDNWVFSTPDGLRLIKHSEREVKSSDYVKVKGTESPFNGNWVYWSQRRGQEPTTPTRVAKLLKRQKGKCTHCHLHFNCEDIVEIDHIIPTSKGGKDTYDNLQAMHRHCHDEKTRNDGSIKTRKKESQCA